MTKNESIEALVYLDSALEDAKTAIDELNGRIYEVTRNNYLNNIELSHDAENALEDLHQAFIELVTENELEAYQGMASEIREEIECE